MNVESFDKLVLILSDVLIRDERQGRRRGGAIPPHLCVLATIRWLSGGTYLDIATNVYSPFESLVGQSMTRHQMVLKISEMGLTRPTSSVVHNRRLANSTSFHSTS
jgi:hypothetical protein